MKKVIQGGTIINEDRQFQADLVIEGGKITQILAQAPETLLQEAQVIDASHCFVIPGVIDDQVHFREPGLTHKGNIEAVPLPPEVLLLLWICPMSCRQPLPCNCWKRNRRLPAGLH